MYCGFLPAFQLREIATVPKFAPTKQHHQIASDISHPPVDQWQRPLEDEKTKSIKDTYSRTDKDNLMANPVLLGVASLFIDSSIFVSIDQKAVSSSSGEKTVLENIFDVIISFTSDKKPLWILDGQHRIEGMNLSVQKNEPIPFVLLYHDRIYTGPFLAEIFTQVTTGATPMQPLHAAWMKYAFGLDRYSQPAPTKSMRAVITLCKEVELGKVTNPFFNKIQFNPYLPPTGHGAFSFNMSGWEEIITENYYGRSGTTLSPDEVAAELVKAITVLEDLDTTKTSGSKLFSNTSHTILAEGFLSGLLKHLAETNSQKAVEEWRDFYTVPERAFNRCRWNLPFVRSGAASSSVYGSPSKIIAKECFDLAFNDPSSLNGAILTDYLQGVEAKIKLTMFEKTAAGRIKSRSGVEKIINPEGTQTNWFE
jgi:hypothetical protein